jgi:hypothetical protein
MKHGVDYLRPRDFNFGEDWVEVFLEVKNIRKGDVFFECERGVNHRLVALTSARRVNDGFYVVAETSSNEKVEIFYSEFTSYPAPNFYREPQYLTQHEDELVYELG